jgi:predicted glycosyltransferase
MITSLSTLPVESPSRAAHASSIASGEKIWIDLDNSPHVPFFAPIIEELTVRGYPVVLTARDCFQVRELADLLGLRYKLIGHHYGKNRSAKLAGLCIRALQLFPTVRRARPSVAISHGSRSQLLISRLLGMRSVIIGDYEFAKISAGIRPDWMIVPQMVPMDAVARPTHAVLTYPGIKEDVYASSFKPVAGWRSQLGLREHDLVVTVRPPATEAHYHVPESDALFDEVMHLLAETPGLRVVMLPRSVRQAYEVRQRYSSLLSEEKLTFPTRAVDGLNLVWHSDLVISGGGTMNREAAALGVPVYSTFRGRTGAVDKHLAQAGRLTLIEDRSQVRSRIKLVRRNRPDRPPAGNSAALNTIVGHLTSILGGAE